MELEKPKARTRFIDQNAPGFGNEENQLRHNFKVGGARAISSSSSAAAAAAAAPSSSSGYSECVVAPAKPLEERWISLSVLDRFILPIYIPVYFIYESIPGGSFDEFVCKLKSSLAEVLVSFYPFSGRLERNKATGSWDVYCDNKGAEFRVAYLDEELRNTCYARPCLELRLLAPKVNAVPKDGGQPVRTLYVQVTRFKCGAVALGCSFHHQIADAYAVSHFTRTWARIARGEAMDFEPIHDRSSVIPEEVMEAAATATAAPVAIVGTRGDGSAVESSTTTTDDDELDDFREGAMEGYLFDVDAVAKLKRMSPGATSFEVVTAFVARHVIAALAAAQANVTDDGLAKFVLMVDFRGRINAPRFSGNAALPMAVIRPRPDFLGGGLDKSWAPVHAAVLAANVAYYQAFVRHAGRGPPSKERALAVSSCSRLPLYAVDFGWGAPSFSGILPPVPRLVPDFLLLLPPQPQSRRGYYVAYLQLQRGILQAVDSDPSFSSIAKKYRPLDVDPSTSSSSSSCPSSTSLLKPFSRI